MSKFGQTWWGKEWLNSLENIDYSNRLPRGRAYAGNGSVKTIEIDKNIIKAKVQGTRSTPYKVTITVPKFTEANKQVLIDFIKYNASLLSKLLNKQLPEEINKFANSKGIHVFPTTWRDFDMSCSCPDWATPCKHIAAVIYIVANEIDKNPFIVFELHGFDMLESFKNVSNPEIYQIQDDIKPISQFISEKEPDLASYEFKQEYYDALDYSVIKDIKQIILSLLTPKPLFYEKDFKVIINSMYQDTSIGTKFYLNQLHNSATKVDNSEILSQIKSVKLELSESYELQKVIYDGENATFNIKTDISELIKLLKSIEDKNISDYSPYIIALHTILIFSAELLINYAYVPQILKISDTQFRMRWIPAIVNEEVGKVFKHIMAITPPDTVLIESTLAKKKKSVYKYQTPDEQLLTLCSVFINQLMSQYVDQVYNSKMISKTDKICNLFFKNQSIEFVTFREKQIPMSIQQWLTKFYINYKEFVPILKIEDADNQFEIEILIENKEKSFDEPMSLKKFFSAKAYQSKKLNVLKDLTLISEHFVELNEIINSEGSKRLMLNSDQLVDVMMKSLPAIRLFGITILLPKSLKTIIRPQLSLKMSKKESKKNLSFLTIDELLTFDWQIAMGEVFVDVDEFRKLVKNMSGIVRIKDQFIYINEKEINQIYQNLLNPPKLNSSDLLKIALTEEYEEAKIAMTEEVARLIDSLTNVESMALPDNLNAELRPYQVRGYEWLIKNARVGFGSIIADDMGLGKTLQGIALLLKFKQEKVYKKKKALIIVPTTLISNWQKEIERFAPELKLFVYHGQNRSLDYDDAELIITSYGTLRNDVTQLQEHKWHTIVVDEAQNIKNHSTEQTKAVKLLKSDVRIAMTGTPVENRLGEYWSIFDFINKGFLNSQTKFNKEFANEIEVNKNHTVLEKFKKVTQPFILRRMKSDKTIIADLPDKIENNQYCSLSKEQAAIYQETLNNVMQVIEESEGIARKGMVLKLITGLKQICNHPFHYLKKGNKSADLSGKTALLFSILENIYENKEKTLIFTQYTEMGDLLVEMIEAHFKTPVLFLHGGLSLKKRDELIDNFQNKRNFRTFVLSLKAGGTGLNLTAARNVIHYDLWWNPAVEAQATDRAYRIGQTENVMVYRLLTKGTFEEKIDDMINRKKELASMAVSTGEKWIGELNNDELKNIFRLEKS